MKKIFLVFASFALTACLVFAQDAAAPVANAQQQNSTTATTTSGGDSNVVAPVVKYAPTFNTLRSLDNKNVDADFARVITIIQEIETDYLFRIQYKADKILSEYTNARFIDTNNSMFTYTYLYNIVSKILADDPTLSLAMSKIDNGFSIVDSVKPVMLAFGKTNEIQNAEYKLNLYSGIFSLYTGSVGNLKSALRHFEKIIDEKLTENKDDLMMVYNYAAGVSDILLTKQVDALGKKYYYNKIFNNLWQYITLATGEGEERDSKYRIIIQQYYTVVYTGTPVFENTYATYFDKFGYPYKKPEEKKETASVATTPVSTTPPVADTTTTPATTTPQAQ